MCGIAVICNLSGQPAERSALERMTRSIMHRGPDDAGHYLSGPVGLGFRRLAILDLSATGHQPMVSSDGRYVLVFNGEIYNFIELRSQLTSLGYEFRSTGDSEVLLNAYRQWGAECLSKFNGMWAFVIYDRVDRLLFGSRDRFGVKPLFVYRQQGHVLFASEIKAIRASGLYRGGINWKVASRFLLEGHLDDTRESFYEGIESIDPGSAFEQRLDGSRKVWKYWDPDNTSETKVEAPVRQFADLFEDAVRLRLRSDVPVGVCLSGGLDSTSIVCAAARERKEIQQSDAGPLRAFCYMAKEFDESRYIADTLKLSGAQLYELQTTPMELWGSLKRMLWYHDEPVHTMTAAVGFHLMNLVASNGIRVVLNGQGADETIGGYFSYFFDYWRELINRSSIRGAVSEINEYTAVHGGRPFQLFKKSLTDLIVSKLQRYGSYRMISDNRHARKIQQHPWFSRELTSAFPSEERLRGGDTLNEVLRQSVLYSPLPLYLRIEDRNSMAHSIEARLPFLDYRLVLLVSALGSDWKIRGPWNKHILREAMRDRIPESVRSRPDKMGFPTAGRQWFAQSLYEPMADVLGSREVRERGIYNTKTIVNDLERHRRGEVDVHHDLFHLAEFEMIAELLQGNAATDRPVPGETVRGTEQTDQLV
ncbi:Asparagine synthetase [Nitrospira sp. KM1]|uniref:asparagine synthase (glutamine-hydrolyzing) n=1 Tax=Nitrospira sp. KM1 TaxID=1936990 RepID=UPI0013A79379|nr:asparagine synthase (glutamine-hydrolyzing) [Nitrospira sp. KM1]BCA54111.1 Asparagine synthetase [Nitrospira sp. KM1]